MKDLKKMRERIRKVTCEIEEWIEKNECADNARLVKRLDKAVFMIKIGNKIMKNAIKKAM